jgi:hypothetical protein
MDRIVLTASEGMMLTNGEGFWVRLELGYWDSPDNYREVSIEEYEKMLEADAEVT